MRKNVFLKSTLRQPVRAALLAAVIALITFAFVARASEYLLVRQETERLGAYYRAVGTLESTAGDRWADTGEAAAYLASNSAVALVNVYNQTSAVMEEPFCNADTGVDSVGKESWSLAFCGTLRQWDHETFSFSVDTVLAGYPEHIREGGTAVMFRTKSGDPRDVDAAYAQLEAGARYLVMGYYQPSAYPRCQVETAGGGLTTYIALTSMEEGRFFHPVPMEGTVDWSDPVLGAYEKRIAQIRDGQRALNIVALRDMSALPLTQDSDAGIYLTEGRWLDGEDDALERRVCVVNANLASMRGLALGDSLTLRLRDIPSWQGYNYDAFGPEGETSTDTYEIVGIYDYISKYRSTVVRNYTYVPASAVPGSFALTTGENVDQRNYEFVHSQYLGKNAAIPYPGEVSFSLVSPDDEARFLSETREDLARMGFKVVMSENNWANFQAAAVPMKRSSLLSAAIFSALLLAAFCLLAVIYYRMRRKEIAIARALGVPAWRCARDVSVPLLLLGLPGIAAGAYLGWQYTLGNAAGTLSALGDLGGEVIPSLPVLWLAALGGGALALLLLVTLGGAAFLSSRPVLTLVQGGGMTARRDRAETAQAPGAAVPSAVPAHTAVSVRRAETSAPAGSGRGGAAHVLRFVWRHIARAKVKSALSILLAAGFTAGLAAIQLSIAGSREKIDWLYENTAVEAELLLADSTREIKGGGFLRQSTVDALLDSGYVTDAYLEGSATGAVIRYAPGMENGRDIHIAGEDISDRTIRALNDADVFLSPAGSGGAVTVTYFDGWDGSLFASEWTADEFPVILPKTVYMEFGGRIGLSCKGFRVCRAAGYYEGEVAGTAGETDPVLIPLSAYRDMSNARAVAYSKAHVTLDPSLNRELEAFTQLVNDLSASQGFGAIALRAVIWDEELRLAVAPLENSIRLMEVLYPVTLALSLLAAAGISVLFVMTSAKEAAIMRILGTSRMRSRAMLTLQTAFTSAAGLLLGLAAILAYAGRTRPGLLAVLAGTSALWAALYLLSAVLGAAASAAAVTGKNPLELLQVRE